MLKAASFLLIFCSALFFSSCAGSKAAKEREDAKEVVDAPTQHQMDDTRRGANENMGTGPLGTSTNPIKCGGVEGAKKYLEKIRGPKGQKITFVEAGDQGMGPFGSLVYLYNIEYPTPQGPVQEQLFFDYDFDGFDEPKAPKGFRLR